MISIDWGARIIFIPKADLNLVQLSPTEIYNMDLNWFRLQLKDIEDGEDGICFPSTHNHNTEVSLGGLTFARVIEIINDYTLTFEDGQYAVNLVGANSNIADRVNVNQVSVRSANSAGLISSPAIEYSSYNGGVHVNTSSSYFGTIYPIGTPQKPVNNFLDALLIAEYRGFTSFNVYGSATVDGVMNYTGYSFIGESQTKTTLNVLSAANVMRCEYYDATISGVLDGEAKIKDCFINDLIYINGVIESSLLGNGTIVLGGNANAYFMDCWSGAIGDNMPTIDMGSSGQNLVLRNYNGAVRITNLHNSSNYVAIDLGSGHVVLDTSITAGNITIRGVGTLIDGSSGTTVITDALISKDLISQAVLNTSLIGFNVENSMASSLKRILGLLQENQFLDQTVYSSYNGQKLLTSGRIRIYSDAATVGTNSNVIATYQIEAVWSMDTMQSYKVTRL